MTKIWWANQQNLGEDVLWAALKDDGGGAQPHWDAVRKTRMGDIILHFTDQHVVAVSEVVVGPKPMKYPFDPDIPERERRDGTLVELGGHLLDYPIHRDDIPLSVRKKASTPGEGGPFQANGAKVKQGYLYPVGEELWDWLAKNNEQIAEFSELGLDGSLEVFLEGAATDIEVSAVARREQAWLRSILLDGATEGECGICGKVFPERYLHAAHIKKRSDASEKERRDPNIGMLACLFGCDQAFECGDVLVLGDGAIRLGDPDDPFLKETFGFLEGKKAPAHREENAHYFAARTASFTRVPDEGEQEDVAPR